MQMSHCGPPNPRFWYHNSRCSAYKGSLIAMGNMCPCAMHPSAWYQTAWISWTNCLVCILWDVTHLCNMDANVGFWKGDLQKYWTCWIFRWLQLWMYHHVFWQKFASVCVERTVYPLTQSSFLAYSYSENGDGAFLNTDEPLPGSMALHTWRWQSWRTVMFSYGEKISNMVDTLFF
jgi:hypothetical protein